MSNVTSKLTLTNVTTSLFAPRSGYRFRFFRAGGLDQVRIETADDLRHLGELDKKLWVALSCPVKGLEFDSRTLALLDTDKDQRVRIEEVLAAVRWICTVLKDPATIFAGAAELPLAAINEVAPEGATLIAAAQQILTNLGRPDATTISVDAVSDTTKIFAETTFNGDGVVKPGCAQDSAIRAAIEDIIKISGADVDRSGKVGINQQRSDLFFTEAQAFSAWHMAGTNVLTLGSETSAAHTAFSAIVGKIDDYFARCNLVAVDPRSAGALNRPIEDYLAISAKDLGLLGAEVANLPLQQVAAQRPLELHAAVNPAWQTQINTFRNAVMERIAAPSPTLDEATWTTIKARFAPYTAWLASKAGSSVEPLGIDRIRTLDALGAQAAINALIVEDLAVKPKVDAIESVERLVRYHRDLALLLRNFINFGDFYDRTPPPPIFIHGTLFLDQRSFDLCLKIDDIAAHGTLANLGRVFIAYCTCTRTGGEKMLIAVGITNGDSDYLIPGRNGVFYDLKGRDWDATITKLIDHPISIQQAFWAPYKKIGKMINDTIEKIASDKDKAMMDKAGTSVTASANQVAAGAKPAVEKPKIDTGMLAAIGIATASLASAVGGIAAAVLGLAIWKIPLVVIGVILAISGPAMVIAYLKLRQRTLGPLLEGNGWAINGRVKINLPLGRSLTNLKELPANAERSLADPFEDQSAAKTRRRIKNVLFFTVVIAGIVLWRTGHMAQWWNTLTMSDTNRTATELSDIQQRLKEITVEVDARKAVLEKDAAALKAELDKSTPPAAPVVPPAP